jgi:class 3 adenylate cyclase/TolB-like protein/Tfp pilus assembly protein PilF
MEDDTTQERRLSAIMFTDMVGYSALTHKNEALAVELLEKHRVILRSSFEQHQGKEIEIIGDAFFVEFTSTLNAVRCAIEIQQKLYEGCKEISEDRWIRIRIGIHVGDVIHKDKQVIGDCVNIAARIEPLADPGGICLSEDVVRQIYNKIDLPLKCLGKGELKNIRLPMQIYKVILPRAKSSILFPSNLFVLKQKKKIPLYIAVSLIICLFLYIAIQYLSEFNTFTGPQPENLTYNRLAVLPFENFSPDKNDDYISDGFTEEITAVLSKITTLHVIPSLSVKKYKNNLADVKQIARVLNTGIILDGSVRKEKDRIRITAQLIDTKSEVQIKNFDYDEKYDRILDLQIEIAYKIAQALKITLKEREKKWIEKKSTKNIEAYDLYLQGRFFWHTRIPQNLMRGLECFHEAINIDPDFALAYAGIADTYHLLASYGMLAPKVGFELAKKAAKRALEIDEDLVEAYNSLAATQLLFEWKWREAETNFMKALELDQNYVQTYSWYALLLSVNKRFDQAKIQLKRALVLDPQSAITQTDLGQVHYHAGEYPQAIEEYHKSLQLDSNYVYTFAYLGQAYAMQNMLDEAERAFSYAVELTQKMDAATLAGLAHVYAKQEKSDQAKAILEKLLNFGDPYYVHPMYLAIIYLALGDKVEALNSLEQGLEERSEWMIFLQVEHMLDPLRNDDRFVELVNRMKFESTNF